MFEKKKTIKKKIKYNNIIIKLYKVDINKISNSGIANIEAFDLNGNLMWTIELPSRSLHYYDMQIDEENKELEADSGSGFIYTIDLKDGHIIKSRLIK